MASRICGWSSAAKMRAGRAGSCSSAPAPLCSASLVCAWALGNVFSPGRDAIDRFLDLDAIIRQSRSGCALQFDLRLLVGSIGIYQIEFCQRKVTLRGQCLESRSGAQFLLLLHDGEGSLRKIAGLLCCLHAGLALFQCILRVANLNANLLLELLHTELGLPIFEFGTVLVGFRYAVANRNVNV